MVWVVEATPRPLTPGKHLVIILQVAGLAPGAGLYRGGKSGPPPPPGIDPRTAQPLASEVRQRSTKEERDYLGHARQAAESV